MISARSMSSSSAASSAESATVDQLRGSAKSHVPKHGVFVWLNMVAANPREIDELNDLLEAELPGARLRLGAGEQVRLQGHDVSRQEIQLLGHSLLGQRLRRVARFAKSVCKNGVEKTKGEKRGKSTDGKRNK